MRVEKHPGESRGRKRAFISKKEGRKENQVLDTEDGGCLRRRNKKEKEPKPKPLIDNLSYNDLVVPTAVVDRDMVKKSLSSTPRT